MPVARKEVLPKVTGSAEYVDDVQLPGMLHGATVRSTIPRGLIRDIRFHPAIPWQEFTIVRASDIPGRNLVALIFDDQPCLAGDRVNHVHEPILLLAHPDKDLLRKAVSHVHIDYDQLPPVFDIEAASATTQVIWGTDNVFKRFLINKGDVDACWGEAAHIVEGEYSTGAQEQLYIEPNGMLATFDPANGITVRGSLQCPFYVQKALAGLFGFPPDKIRVIQQETGGAFGGKEEYPSMIAGHAALLAWKSGRPVKLIYDREEDMAATTKRHPSRTRHRTAIDSNGCLLAMDIEFIIDGGAYATLSGVVLSRGTIHAPGPYRCDNVRVRSTAFATNTPPHGAFRGFGAPQSIFALERHMNKVAAVAGLTPEEFRARNLQAPGDTTATGQAVQDSIDLPALQRRALEAAGYFEKRRTFPAQNATGNRKHGIGFATFFHGAGFTGSGERMLQSKLTLELTAEGRVIILTSITEMGQGAHTVLSLIAAETLGIPYHLVDVQRPDTLLAPNSGPTVASRTAMVIGRLVERAARQLQAQLPAFTPQTFADVCRLHGPLQATVQYEEPPGILWDDVEYRGEAYGAYSFATYVAAVSVDTLTGEVQVDDFVALQEVGHVLHPILAAGQIEGGVAQGIGWALYEKVVWRDGAMANNQLTNYILPTTVDMPPVRVFFEEIPYAHGALGAKGIGELPMDGPAPAILNAIEHALGLGFDHVPLMPEDILEGLYSRRVA